MGFHKSSQFSLSHPMWINFGKNFATDNSKAYANYTVHSRKNMWKNQCVCSKFNEFKWRHFFHPTKLYIQLWFPIVFCRFAFIQPITFEQRTKNTSRRRRYTTFHFCACISVVLLLLLLLLNESRKLLLTIQNIYWSSIDLFIRLIKNILYTSWWCRKSSAISLRKHNGTQSQKRHYVFYRWRQFQLISAFYCFPPPNKTKASKRDIVLCWQMICWTNKNRAVASRKREHCVSNSKINLRIVYILGILALIHKTLLIFSYFIKSLFFLHYARN